MKQYNDVITKTLINIFCFLSLLVTYLHIIHLSPDDFNSNIIILILLGLGTTVTILHSFIQINKPIFLIIMLINYFSVLIHPYFQPNQFMLEFIWTPVILLTIAVYFPGFIYTLLIFGMGIPGSIFFSYGYCGNLFISLGEVSYPYHIAVFPFYFSITVFAVIICCYRIFTQKRNERVNSLEEYNAQLNKINHSISQKIFNLENDSTIEERKRISKEIHDTAGYVFVNLIMMLQAASAVFHKDANKAENLITDARDYAERGINEIRHILRNIRSYSPARISLQNEIYNIGNAFSRATDVQININYGNWPQKFSDNIDSMFLSFIQESLTNALKHGHATSISISCWMNKISHTMSVADNGTGAVLPLKKGIGITALEDIVSRYNGNITIISDRAGFNIQVSIPVNG